MNQQDELFLSRLSGFLRGLSTADGHLVCPWHHLEHTGKNIYAAEIDWLQYESTKDESDILRAKARILAAVANLGRDYETGAWIFLPGRHGRTNLANNVIDCGACVDVIANFLARHGGLLTDIELRRAQDAVVAVSDAYLQRAVVKKEVPNQRLWGATGLSAAWRLMHKEDWRKACLESAECSLVEQSPDGSFPYHPNWKRFRCHSDMSDITTYYQSRHLAFLYYVYAMLEIDMPEHVRSAFLRGCDFLIGVMHPDGIKEMSFEQKRYYWNPYYEVASNSFDTYALSAAFHISQNPIYGHYAQQALKQLVLHQRQDGRIDGSSHVEQDFKCPVFIACQAVWAVRSLAFLPTEKVPAPNSEKSDFPDSGVMKYRSERYCAMFRYRKKPTHITWGTPIGGGALVYLGSSADWTNAKQPAVAFGPHEGDFEATPIFQSIVGPARRFFRSVTPHDIRFRLWLASVEYGAGKRGFAMMYPLAKIVVPFFRCLLCVYRSYMSLGVEKHIESGHVRFSGRLATYDGNELCGSLLQREYRFGERGLRVSEDLKVPGRHWKVEYLLPVGAKGIKVNSRLRWRMKGRRLIWRLPKSMSCRIEYELDAQRSESTADVPTG